MVFSSATFLIVFLPLTMVLYYLVGVVLTKSTAVKNFILLVASLVFYAWGEPVYIILMLLLLMDVASLESSCSIRDVTCFTSWE